FDGTDNVIFAVDTNGVLTITPSGAAVEVGGDLIFGTSPYRVDATAGGLVVGVGAGAPVPDQQGIHVWKGSAGAVGVNANTLLVLENSSNALMSFLGPTSSVQGIEFGDTVDNNAGRLLYRHATNQFDFDIGGSNRLIYSAGSFDFQEATVVDILGGYLQLTERSAPGAGAADTARIYAIVDGGTMTDLAAVFQDGTVDIFAQETTPLDAPIFTYASGTEVKMVLKKLHPGVVELVAVFPNGSEWTIKSLEYHNSAKIAANVGTESPKVPSGWVVDYFDVERIEYYTVEEPVTTPELIRKASWDPVTQQYDTVWVWEEVPVYEDVVVTEPVWNERTQSYDTVTEIVQGQKYEMVTKERIITEQTAVKSPGEVKQ
ncbi:hypothetical protein LCGC14_0975140, partial [marine sediment metagenome]